MANIPLDENGRPTLAGISNVDGKTIVDIWVTPDTHRVLVDGGGAGSVTFVDNEVVSGSGTSFTLASTPTVGSVHVYGLGQRLVLTTDYSITTTAITTVNSWSAGQIIADYRK